MPSTEEIAVKKLNKFNYPVWNKKIERLNSFSDAGCQIRNHVLQKMLIDDQLCDKYKKLKADLTRSYKTGEESEMIPSCKKIQEYHEAIRDQLGLKKINEKLLIELAKTDEENEMIVSYKEIQESYEIICHQLGLKIIKLELTKSGEENQPCKKIREYYQAIRNQLGLKEINDDISIKLDKCFQHDNSFVLIEADSFFHGYSESEGNKIIHSLADKGYEIKRIY